MTQQAPLETAERAPPARRRLRVMADHCAEGLWDMDEGGVGLDLSDPDLSDLPPAFLARLDAWSAWYDRECDDYKDPQDRRKPGLDWASFALEGWRIARALKALRPGWEIFYFDEHASQFMGFSPEDPRSEDRPRSEYEYEVV